MALIGFYRDHIIDTGRQPAFLLLAAFLITFALTRLYTRLARVRGWGSGSAGGIHLHHMAFGIVLILLAGFFDLALDPGHPWLEIIAIAFGIGAALTLDEFALWLYLKDVYWTEEGRSSIDAIILAVLLAGLVSMGLAPLGIDATYSAETLAFWIVVNLLASLIALLKGKLYLGVAGLFIPFLSWFGAIRLARPSSPWARWRYRNNEQKLAKARAREEKRKRRKLRIRDWIGGEPHLKSPQP